MATNKAIKAARAAQFRIVDAQGSEVRGPIDSEAEAYAIIEEHEQHTGEIPGIDHGFGMGSGWRVEQIN